MKTNQNNRLKTAVCAGVLVALGASANAQLLHYYQFSTDTANDEVGTANGTLAGTATLSGGALNTDGTLGGGSTPQNGLILPSSAVAGITGAFTIDTWFYANYNGGYCTAFSFSDGTESNYVLATPARGNSPYASTISVIGGGGAVSGGGDIEAAEQYEDNATLHNMVVTYDGNTLSYYIDGVLGSYSGLPSSIIDAGLNLSSLPDVGVAGGSPWPDNSIKGQTYSFGIFGQALTPAQVASLDVLGDNPSAAAVEAVAAPEPSTLALAGLGIFATTAMRRFKKPSSSQAD